MTINLPLRERFAALVAGPHGLSDEEAWNEAEDLNAAIVRTVARLDGLAWSYFVAYPVEDGYDYSRSSSGVPGRDGAFVVGIDILLRATSERPERYLRVRWDANPRRLVFVVAAVRRDVERTGAGYPEATVRLDRSFGRDEDVEVSGHNIRGSVAEVEEAIEVYRFAAALARFIEEEVA